ncbi:MAG: glycosyltransferase [Vicinamibacterales bacterium]
MRLAFITPRYGAEIPAGPEHACRLLAEHVVERHDVDVLTTCAPDPLTWKNDYAEGADKVRGVLVRRFAVSQPHDREAFRLITSVLRSAPHSRTEELDWVAQYGPTAPGLLDFLKRQHKQYDAIVFFSLQHATTVHGLPIAPDRSVLFPYLQCRPSLRFGLWADLIASARGTGLFSAAERPILQAFMPGASAYEEVVGIGIEPAQQLAYPRHQQDPNDVVTPDDELSTDEEPLEAPDYLSGRGVPFRRRHRLYGPLALYDGRLEADNGAEEMLEYFESYSQHDSETTLVLMGAKMVNVPENPRVRLAGVLPVRDRMFAYEAADVTMAPASDDLLSQSVLESLAVGTPVLASARNTAAVEHCRRSGGGLYYANGEEFADGLRTMMTNTRLRERLGESGRQYARQQLRWEAVLGRFERLIGRVKRS